MLKLTALHQPEGRRQVKKTYITKMPDESGAFLEASRIIAANDANITRVSYNKAIDSHALFIDVEGDSSQIKAITEGLERLGYIHTQDEETQVMLLEFKLLNIPGSVMPVLDLIYRYRFNISYMSSQEDGSAYQNFKMGLFVENPEAIKKFLDQAIDFASVKIIEYDRSERILDNTVFYLDFANQVAKRLKLGRKETVDLIAQSNHVMQMLEERNESPYKTFEYLGKLVDLLAKSSALAFKPRIGQRLLQEGAKLHSIEPPCGSTTYILEKEDRFFFIDCGFACYQQEMLEVFQAIIPRFASRQNEIAITHPDMDHCGLLSLFDTIYVSRDAFLHFSSEQAKQPNFREQNPFHLPYSRISRIVSRYEPPRLECLQMISEHEPQEQAQPLIPIGSIHTCGFMLDVYRGNGGHAKGEIVLVDEKNKLVFTGDIIVNPKGFTPEQAAFNKLAPYLMTSVNMNSQQAAKERNYLLDLFSPRHYTYCCGHGAFTDSFPNATTAEDLLPDIS